MRQAITASGSKSANVVGVDLRVDSDRTGLIDFGQFEDLIEDKDNTGVFLRPWVIVNDGDTNRNGILDYVDFDDDGIAAGGGTLVPIVVQLIGAETLAGSEIRLTFDYEASAPTGFTAAGGVKQPNDGQLRLWKMDGNRDSKSVTKDGHFIPAGEKVTLAQLGAVSPSSPFTLYLEGVNPSGGIAGSRIEVTLTATNGITLTHADAVRVLVDRIDLDVDSDHDNLNGAPSRSQKEDSLELKQPAILAWNGGDLNHDGVPDFADGFNGSGNQGAGQSSKFLPMKFEGPHVPIDFKVATVTFTYQASHPEDTNVSGHLKPANRGGMKSSHF